MCRELPELVESGGWHLWHLMQGQCVRVSAPVSLSKGLSVQAVRPDFLTPGVAIVSRDALPYMDPALWISQGDPPSGFRIKDS